MEFAKQWAVRETIDIQFLSETFCLHDCNNIIHCAYTLFAKMFAAFVPEGLHFNY